jgi:hypothetical protein
MSPGLLLAAAQLYGKGMRSDVLAKALGLTGNEATDFLSAITE